MKYYLILLVVALASCKNQTETKINTSESKAISGEAIFTENNCAACHKPDQKVVGPSLQDIAKIYKEQNGDMVAFLQEETDPIVDPTMYETMKINLQVTKTMSKEELNALEDYIISFAQ